MTVPTGSGPGAFEYTNDTVAARVSVDVPADALRSLDAVVASTNELRTNLEASARANHDVVEYLGRMPLLIESINEAQSRYQGAVVIGGGGGPDPRVPLSGRNDPVPTGGGAQTERGGVRSAAEVQEALNDLEDRDPRQAANMRAQRRRGGAGSRPGAPARPGSGRPPRRDDSAPSTTDEPDPENHSQEPSPDNRMPGSRPTPSVSQDDWLARGQQFANQGSNFVNQVLNETRQGQTGLGNGNAAIRGVRTGAAAANALVERRALAAHIAEGGTAESFRGAGAAGGRMGAASSALGGAARVAGVAGIAYAAVEGSQKIGEQYQAYKNQGMIRGGGASEGLGYEMQIRTMAMNPFLNTEQSRKIINTALSEGYTGKEFDNVTEFMADNLKKMNLSVADSVKLLDKNVNAGGQSLASLNGQLSTLKNLAGGGYNTLGDRQQAFAQVSGQAIDNGAGGADAGTLGIVAGDLFDGNKNLQGTGTSFVNALQTNVMAQNSLRSEYDLQGVAPDQLMASAIEVAKGRGEDAYDVLAKGGAGVEAQIKKELAAPFAALDGMDPQSPAYQTKKAQLGKIALIKLKGMGFSGPETTTEAKAFDFVLEALKGGLSGGVRGTQAEVAESDRKVEDTKDPTSAGMLIGTRDLGTSTKSLGSALKTGWAAIDDTVGVVGSFLGWGEGSYDDTRKSYQEGEADFDNNDARYKNERIQELVRQYGSGKIQVDDGKGGKVDLDQNDKAMVEAIAQDKKKISVDGGAMMSLTDATAENKSQTGGSSTEVLISLTAEAKRLIVASSSTRTSTQQNADAGRSGSSYNSPTPSETAPWQSSGGN